MGLIKAGMGALGGTLADQWKEFFYCDALDKDVLMVKGQKRTSRRSSNYGDVFFEILVIYHRYLDYIVLMYSCQYVLKI